MTIDHQPNDHQDRLWLAAGLIIAGLAVSITLAAMSQGGYHDDDLTHYQFARWAWIWPEYLLHSWGRPGFTLLHFLPARFGWLACRWTSGLLSAATALLAYATARRLRLPLPWTVPLLIFAQPLFLTLSYTTLTETALALYLAAAVYLLVANHPLASAAVLSLGFVTRYECVVFIPIWVALLWPHKRRWLGFALLLWAPVLHNLLAWPILEELPLLAWLAPNGITEYGHGCWTTFLAKTTIAFGAGITPLAAAGVRSLWRRQQGWPIALSCAAYLLAETVVRATGSYGSGGYARFLVPLAPLIAILACAGLGDLLSKPPRRMAAAVIIFAIAMVAVAVAVELELKLENIYWLGREVWGLRLATLLVLAVSTISISLAVRSRTTWARWLLPLLVVVIAGVQLSRQIRPLHLAPDQSAMHQTIRWLNDNGLTHRPIYVANLWLEEFLGHTRSPRLRVFRRDVALAAPGSIIIWDQRYGPHPHTGLALRELRDNPRWFRLLYRSPATSHEGIFAYVFEKLAGPVASTCPAAGSKL